MELLASLSQKFDAYASAMIDGISDANGIIWHDFVLYIILGAGILFTFWSLFSQYWALAHGIPVVLGRYDNKDDPGAISHFQALSAALSATVGLGNIGGVALAISLGGPGAVFWMWVVGIIGMALKTAEVTLSMMYRDTSDPENPHGGPMWVAQRGIAQFAPALKPLGTVLGGLFCLTLLVSTVTGGNMFQSWNVGEITKATFNVPELVSGIVLAALVGLVIIGGIKRIGQIAGTLVPFMCLLYLVAALTVVALNLPQIPRMLAMIVTSAFSPTEAQGAFVGGTVGFAVLKGMSRALFSSEAGQGSSPIAHSAAKTREPVREAVVAGLEPFIDTLVVCTLTALVILCSGAWNREPETRLEVAPKITLASDPEPEAAENDGPRTWTLAPSKPPERDEPWRTGSEVVFLLVRTETKDESGRKVMSVETGSDIVKVFGNLEVTEPVQNPEDAENDADLAGGELVITWSPVESQGPPQFLDDSEAPRVYVNYKGASLTALAFDNIFDEYMPRAGSYLVLIAAWLFAVSTMISWSYYGEQGIIYLMGQRAVLPYKVVYCLLAVLACAGIFTRERELTAFTDFGTGVMLWVNIPLTILFGGVAMNAYHRYIRRLRAGEFESERTQNPTESPR